MKRSRRSRGVGCLAAAIALAAWALVAPARAEPWLSVDYDPPRLSVEARDVSLVTVLNQIGGKVGFSVTETAPVSAVVTISIRNATLDEVLRQLLRAENSTVLYRATAQSVAMIERIVLSGEPTAALEERRQEPVPAPRRDGLAQGASLASVTPPSSWPEGMTPPSWDPGLSVSNDPGVPPTTVEGLLKAHAMAAVPAPPGPGDATSPPPAPQTNPDAALAESTRRAQQALAALVNGLATATQSLRQGQTAGGK